MHVFSVLVSNTPKRFTPISEYVYGVTLIQHVGRRPWIHLFQLQPSLFPFRSNLDIYIRIEDSPNNAATPRRSTCRRIFLGLPRTPPSSSFRCLTLTILKPHFATSQDFALLLDAFSPLQSIRLSDVTWDAQVHFESGLLTMDLLSISSSSSFTSATVHSACHTAEATWLAFVYLQRRHFSTSRNRDRIGGLQVLPSAQRAILEICKSLCQRQEHKDFNLQLVRFPLLYVRYENVGQ